MSNEEFIKNISREGEEWRYYPDGYNVSSYGRVVSFKRSKPIVMNYVVTTKNFIVYNLNQKRVRLHELLTNLFNIPREPGSILHFINGNSLDQTVQNIQWISVNKETTLDQIPSLEGEEWRRIKDFPNYAISNLGRIYSFARTIHCNNNSRTIRAKFLNPKINVSGYQEIGLSNNNNRMYIMVHRLVAKTFIDNPLCKPFVDHINTDRLDNRACNLRWVTQSENMNNPITQGKAQAPKQPKAQRQKDILLLDSNYNIINWFDSLNDVTTEGYNKSIVSLYCSKKSIYKKQFYWYYLEDYKTLIKSGQLRK